MSKKIVILGAGFAGVLTALTARKYLTAEEAQISVVNQYPTHQINFCTPKAIECLEFVSSEEV